MLTENNFLWDDICRRWQFLLKLWLCLGFPYALTALCLPKRGRCGPRGVQGVLAHKLLL